MRIVQWNCRSIKYKLDELKDLSKDFDIILLSETWVEADQTIQIPGFTTIKRIERITDGVEPLS